MENQNSSTLASAIISTMKEVEGVKKNLSIGSGAYAYKAVADLDVKREVGAAMKNNGLAIVPIKIETNVEHQEFKDETEEFNVFKNRRQVFTEVKVTYCLMHESGESMEVVGYGQATDFKDKGAGKATTYALKYALLYTFMIPTGSIDDSDNYDSRGNNERAKKKKQKLDKSQFEMALESIEADEYDSERLRKEYNLTDSQEKKLKELEDKMNNVK